MQSHPHPLVNCLLLGILSSEFLLSSVRRVWKFSGRNYTKQPPISFSQNYRLFLVCVFCLRFCFRFCDSVLGFATFFFFGGGVILFWVLRFYFVPIYHRKNAFRELKQRRQTATDNLTLQMQHTSSSLPDYVGSWPRFFKRWIALPLG